MDNEKKVQEATLIILKAGDARLKATEALKALEVFAIADADRHLQEAYDFIREAHKVQTTAIQDEIRGIKSESSLLFNHAQDTLMTIYSELNLTKRLIKIIAALNTRIQKVEER